MTKLTTKIYSKNSFQLQHQYQIEPICTYFCILQSTSMTFWEIPFFWNFLFCRADGESDCSSFQVALALQISLTSLCAMSQAPLAYKLFSGLQKVAPCPAGLIQEELAAKGIKPTVPDSGIEITAHTGQISQLYVTEANDATLKLNCLRQVKGGHCAKGIALLEGSPLVWETPSEHHER